MVENSRSYQPNRPRDDRVEPSWSVACRLHWHFGEIESNAACDGLDCRELYVSLDARFGFLRKSITADLQGIPASVMA